MKRLPLTPRPDWREKSEALGFTYHTHETGPYWDERAHYVFSSPEIDELEAAANTLHQLCLDAAQVVIDREWWSRLGIPAAAVPSILDSWNRDDASLYGRFDLAYDGTTPPKLLEYNADTPTALIEAAVVQWYWLQERFPSSDQCNSIHERLIDAWRHLGAGRVHFAAVRDLPEDTQTITYLMDTCQQAGFETHALAIDELGWDAATSSFVDQSDAPISALFKLYPWEWLWQETFAAHLATAKNLFIEPPWKLLLSNKGLLPLLWELNPGHPNLLPSFPTADASLHGNYVRKPLLSREGANVTLVERGVTVEENSGDYGAEGFIYQALAPLPNFDGHRPVCGVWVVDHEACGLGLREDTRRITGNLSRFVPHRMEK
jgi:glutathionylspermidine synthase